MGFFEWLLAKVLCLLLVSPHKSPYTKCYHLNVTCYHYFRQISLHKVLLIISCYRSAWLTLTPPSLASNQPTNQPTNQPPLRSHHPTNQPTNQSDQPTPPLLAPSIQPTNQPIRPAHARSDEIVVAVVVTITSDVISIEAFCWSKSGTRCRAKSCYAVLPSRQ